MESGVNGREEREALSTWKSFVAIHCDGRTTLDTLRADINLLNKALTEHESLLDESMEDLEEYLREVQNEAMSTEDMAALGSMVIEGSASEEEALGELLRLKAKTGHLGNYSCLDYTQVEDPSGTHRPSATHIQEAQRTLYESLCGVWKGYEPPGVDLCLDYRQRFLLSSMMALAPRQDVLCAFGEKRRRDVASKLQHHSKLINLNDADARILEVLFAIGHVEACYRAVLGAVEADLPFLLGLPPYDNAGSIASPFDPISIARIMTGAYLPAFQGEASKAMIRIRDASATPFEEDTHGYPVKFFDQDEPDRPRLDEEILVLRLEHSDGPSSRRGSGQSGDGEEKEGDTSSAAARMRWYKAKVVMEVAGDGPAGTLRTGAGHDRTNEVFILIHETQDRMPLRGNYFIRPALRDRELRTVFSKGRKVLVRNEKGFFYQEGEIVKMAHNDRLCVQLIGTTNGRWTSTDNIIPGPLWQVKAWQFIRPVLRCILDMPRRLLSLALQTSQRHASMSTHHPASSPPHSPVSGRKQQHLALGTPPMNLKATATSPLRKASDDLTPIIHERDLDREITVSWFAGLVEQAEEMAPLLLTYLSHVFSSDLGKERPGAEGAPPVLKWTMAMTPVMKDLAAFLNMCLVGCQEGSYTDAHQTLMGLHRARSNNTLHKAPKTPASSENAHASLMAHQILNQQSPSPGKSPSASPASKSGLQRQRSSMSEPPAAAEDIPKRFAQVMYNVCNCFYLELKHLLATLQRSVLAFKTPSQARHLAEALAFASFLRRSWSSVVERLELLGMMYDVDESVSRICMPVLWKVTALVQEYTSELLERGSNLLMHWCRSYFFQELQSHDWDEPKKTFLEDRRCSYGIQGWSLFLRGLLFDFKTAFYHPGTGGEARELFSSVLARSVATLTAKYSSINPSRVRLAQYVSDMGTIVVTTLTLSSYLRRDPLQSPSLSQEKRGRTHLQDLGSSGYRTLETSCRTHDGGHQAALASLRVAERYCWSLLSILTLLLAPPDVIAWYLRGIKPPENRTASPITLSFVTELEGLRLKSIDEALVNICVDDLAEALTLLMEVRDQFNPISENQRIGSDRELDDEEEEEYGTRGKGSPQPVSKSMTSTQFQEVFVGKKSLENIVLKWKEVLATAPPLGHKELVAIIRRRFELNPSTYPPLEKDATERGQVLQSELFVFEGLTLGMHSPKRPMSMSPLVARRSRAAGASTSPTREGTTGTVTLATPQNPPSPGGTQRSGASTQQEATSPLRPSPSDAAESKGGTISASSSGNARRSFVFDPDAPSTQAKQPPPPPSSPPPPGRQSMLVMASALAAANEAKKRHQRASAAPAPTRPLASSASAPSVAQAKPGSKKPGSSYVKDSDSKGKGGSDVDPPSSASAASAAPARPLSYNAMVGDATLDIASLNSDGVPTTRRRKQAPAVAAAAVGEDEDEDSPAEDEGDGSLFSGTLGASLRELFPEEGKSL